ncbi:MAG: dihydroneopterin aldolase [Sulfurospirillaceae bacterium]|nr:dihydroneopterin aldolase [Sulfurospirillaceae bacterium]
MIIFIEKLTFDAILGILDKERQDTQKITVDAKISYDYTDNEMVDYSQVAQIIEDTIKIKKFYLIEDALEEIVTILKKKFPKIHKIKLKISKPDIINNCVVGAIIKRKLKIY